MSLLEELRTTMDTREVIESVRSGALTVVEDNPHYRIFDCTVKEVMASAELEGWRMRALQRNNSGLHSRVAPRFSSPFISGGGSLQRAALIAPRGCLIV